MTRFGGAELVDWNLAVATAARMSRPGPEVTREEARGVVAELRRHAKASEQHVRAYTGLTAVGDDTPVLVVDRPGWVRANAAGFRTLLGPLGERIAERRAGVPGGAAFSAVGSKVTGVQLGMLLSFLSSRVLGQYETFAPATPGLPGGAGGGRLLLVAPNIVHVERELAVDPTDFRLWVCLHEETHRTQFTAVPWLRDHLENEIQAFIAEADLDPATFLDRLRQAAQSLTGRGDENGDRPGDRSGGDTPGAGTDKAAPTADGGTAAPGTGDAPRSESGKGSAGGSGGSGMDGSLADLVQTARQREILERLTAVMSLLEGHADFVMDGVGPQVVPSVGEIREKFTKRREAGAGRVDRVLRRLLGMDAKLRQYREGERFVRTVVEEVGMAGFNKVWTSPNTLPTQAEIADPQEWVARVRPTGPAS
ncbi:zinc-dependent metalloprotease [Streptomyces lonarensis]|uniref:Zinc-dependent metalloprotease n=1 Tax=Streptomyces lonarensis TaxID=700599 RepID=A0A7X6CXS0_9ACTN|nr:zinc-dependent metalloprotease [Streptomyces lonarensis]NJQ04415.1 zinc-dependent metalloprotease [Streptomyces lonarensis]